MTLLRRLISRKRIVRLIAALSLLLISAIALDGFVQYRRAVHRTREAVLKARLFQLRAAIDTYNFDTGQYPPSLEALVQHRYLRTVPEDPIAQSIRWQVLYAESGAGVRDIVSSAKGKALEGSSYASW